MVSVYILSPEFLIKFLWIFFKYDSEFRKSCYSHREKEDDRGCYHEKITYKKPICEFNLEKKLNFIQNIL